MEKDPRRAIVEKALSDPAFKAALKKNPLETLKKELGHELPEGVSVKVLEDSDSVVHLVLPHASSGQDALSDEQLKGVAGGFRMAPSTWSCLDSSLQMKQVCKR